MLRTSNSVIEAVQEKPFVLKLKAVVWSATAGTFCATTLAFYCLHLATYKRGARDFWPNAQYIWDIFAGGVIFGALFLIPAVLVALLVACTAAYFLSEKFELKLWLVVLIAVASTLPLLLIFGADWITFGPTTLATLLTAFLFFRLQTGRWT